MSREAGKHENFFIAKNCDSESARRALGQLRAAPLMRVASVSSNMRMSEVRSAQVFLAKYTIVCVACFRAVGIVTRVSRFVIDERALCVFASARQRFLKQDGVFSNVLVYSG
jgi:hypothetical protein